jgi:hypothetical protein
MRTGGRPRTSRRTTSSRRKGDTAILERLKKEHPGPISFGQEMQQIEREPQNERERPSSE